MFEQANLGPDTADGVIPTEENNFLVAVNKLLKNYNNTVATKTILHSLRFCTSQFSTMPKDFKLYYDSFIKIAKKIIRAL